MPELGGGMGAPVSQAHLEARLAEKSAEDADIYGSAPLGVSGRKYGMVLGVLRNADDGNGWQPIDDGLHRPAFIESCTTDSSAITINYSDLGAQTTGTFLTVPDETLAQAGIFAGGSISPDEAVVKLGQAMPSYDDYIFYDGSAWQSQRGVISVSSFANGVLTLTHAALPTEAKYALSVVGRGPITADASTGANAVTETTITLEVRDANPPICDYVYYNGAAWVSDKGVFTPSFSGGVLTLTHARSVYASAIWAASMTSRGGVLRPDFIAGNGAVAANSMKIEFRDSAGTVQTLPSTDMAVYVVRPTTGQIISNPTTDMKFYVSHGGGFRTVDPTTINTTTYPKSNLWCIGVHEME